MTAPVVNQNVAPSSPSSTQGDLSMPHPTIKTLPVVSNSYFTEFYRVFFTGIRKICQIAVESTREMDKIAEELYSNKTKFITLGITTALGSLLVNHFLYNKFSLRKMPIFSEILSLFWYLPFIVANKLLQKKITPYQKIMERIGNKIEQWFPSPVKTAQIPPVQVVKEESKSAEKQ